MAFQFVLWIPEVAMVPKGVLVDRPAEAPTPQPAGSDAKAVAMAAEREAVAAATALPTTEVDEQMLMPPMHELFAGKASELVRVRLLALAKLVFSSDPSFAQLSPDRLVHDLHVLDASAWPALPAQESAGPSPSPPTLPQASQSLAPEGSSPLPRPTPRPHDPSASAAAAIPPTPGHASTTSRLVVGDGGAGLASPSGKPSDLHSASGSPPAAASSPGMSDSKAAAGSCVGGVVDATAAPAAALSTSGEATKAAESRDASSVEQSVEDAEKAEKAEKRAKQEKQAAAAAGEGDSEAVADECVTAGVAAKADAADKQDAERQQADKEDAKSEQADEKAAPAAGPATAFSSVASSGGGGGAGDGSASSPSKTASQAKEEEETKKEAAAEAERAAAAVGESLVDRANSAGAGEGVAALAAMAPGDEAVAATGGSGGAGLPDPDGAGDDEDGADAPVPFAARDDVRMARPTAADIGTGRGAMVMFRTIPGEADHVLALLAEQLGIGRDDLPQCGTVSIMSVELTKPRSAMLAPLPDESSEEEDEATPGPAGVGSTHSRKGGSVASRASGKLPPRAKVRARVLVDKILDQIAQGAALSFDYVAMVSVASVLAGVGLATNNAVVIVASMLVSPLMAPVLALTFGIFICDLRLARIGAVTELVGLVICVLFGFMTGLVIAPLAEHADITGGVWPTSEMTSRGTDLGLIVGVVVAIASGCGVALGIAGNNVSGLVGVAISASLLPPIVNAGMLWAYSLSLLWLDGPVATASRPTWRVLIDQGGLSLALALVNIGCILVSATGMFWIKEVAPIAGKSLLFSGTTAAVRRMFVSRIGQEGEAPPGPAGASGPDTPQGGQIGAEDVAQKGGANAGSNNRVVKPPPRPRPIGAQRALRLIIDSGWNIDPAQASKQKQRKRLAGTEVTSGTSAEPTTGPAVGPAHTANSSVRMAGGSGSGSTKQGPATRSARSIAGAAHHTVGYGPSALRRRNVSDAAAPSSDPRGMPPAWREHHRRRRRKVEVRDDHFGIKAKRRAGGGSADGHGRRGGNKSRRGLGAAKAGNDDSDDEEDDEFDSFTVTRQLDMSDFGGRSMLYQPSTLRGQVDASLAAEAAGGKGADRMALSEIMSRLARTRAGAAADDDDDDSGSSSDGAGAGGEGGRGDTSAAAAAAGPTPRGVSDGYQPRSHAQHGRHHGHSAGAGASLDAASGSAYGHQRTLGATQALSQRRMGAAPKRTSLQQMGWQ